LGSNGSRVTSRITVAFLRGYFFFPALAGFFSALVFAVAFFTGFFSGFAGCFLAAFFSGAFFSARGFFSAGFFSPLALPPAFAFRAAPAASSASEEPRRLNPSHFA